MQRRSFIKNSWLTVLSISVFGGLNWNGKSFEADKILNGTKVLKYNL